MCVSKRNIEYILNDTIIDKDDRYIILDITIENSRFSLVNLYSPNLDSPEYFCQS